MPLFLAPAIVEKQGKVYRGKKKSEEEEERRVISELQSILNYKNRKICDCEAQVHDLLQNCLNCGRLTCVAEGPGKCFHCSSLVLSEEQRERFKMHIDVSQHFPGESVPQAQRRACIKIMDKQMDEASIHNRRDLTSDAKQQLKQELNELHDKRNKTKMVLDLNLTKLEANVHSVPVIDDFSSEVQKLQISGPERLDSGTSKTLYEIMESNSKDKK